MRRRSPGVDAIAGSQAETSATRQCSSPRSSTAMASARSPLRRWRCPATQCAIARLNGCLTSSAIRSASSARARPSANAPISAYDQTGNARDRYRESAGVTPEGPVGPVGGSASNVVMTLVNASIARSYSPEGVVGRPQHGGSSRAEERGRRRAPGNARARRPLSMARWCSPITR